MRTPFCLVTLLSGFAGFGCVADPPDVNGSGAIHADGGAAGGEGGGHSSGAGTEGGASAPVTDGDGGGSTPGENGSCAAAPDAGGATCGGDNPVCCGIQPLDGPSGSPTSFACATSTTSCTTNAGGVVVACKSRLDCPGSDVCCGRKLNDNNSVFATVRCEPDCSGTYSYGQATFCDPGDLNACVVNDGFHQACVADDILPGLYSCQRQ